MIRVCVFIDGSGLYFSLKRNNYSTRVDYHELSKALVGTGRLLHRTYYYNSSYDPATAPDQWKSQQPFYESLSRTPYLELKLGKLIPLKEGGFREKGTDIRLATDLVYLAARDIYDIALVLTDETEFSVAISQVKDLGKNVEVCMFQDNQLRELILASDRIVILNEVLESFRKKIFPEIPEAHADNVGNRVQNTFLKTTPLLTRTRSALKSNKSN